jgi:glycosyltransferase involved in cell wall biosynthesis
VVKPASIFHADILARHLREALSEVQPDLVWAEGIELAAALAVLNAAKWMPEWVYSQTDIQFRVRQIRARSNQPLTLYERAMIAITRRAEIEVFKAAPHIITGSTTDAARIREMANRKDGVRVIGMSYAATPIELKSPHAVTPIVTHLGSLETTANRAGLEAYLRKAHPFLPNVPLWVIGEAGSVKPPLKDLLNDPRVEFKGYQPNLGAVLRPYDIAILPYEHDTGYRTKLPLLMGYGQVVVTTRAAIAGTQIEGIEQACMVVDRVEEFVGAIQRLCEDTGERMRLGDAARVFFEKHFTHEAVSGAYAALLKEI